MTQLRKSAVAAIGGLGALALLASPGLAAGGHSNVKAGSPTGLTHMDQGQFGHRGGRSNVAAPGMGDQGMMRPGFGTQGMMGSGMMGSDQGPQGMMGSGGAGFGFRGPVVPSKDLSGDDVRHFLEHSLERHGNSRLTVGEVTEVDRDTVTADITTVDGSLVERFEVDRHTGQLQRVEP